MALPASMHPTAGARRSSTPADMLAVAGLPAQPHLALAQNSLRERGLVNRVAAAKRATVLAMAAPEYQVSVIVRRCSGDKFFLEGSFLLEGRSVALRHTHARAIVPPAVASARSCAAATANPS